MLKNDGKKLKRLIRKNKYLSYILVGGVGIVLIVGASKLEDTWKEILMGIGTGIVASVIGFILLLFLLPDENTNDERFNEFRIWGIERIYPERKNIKITQKKMPSEKLDFIAFGLGHFVKANPVDSMVKYIKNGLTVRIIAPHPQARMVGEQQQLENNDSIATDIKSLIKWKQAIEAKINKLTKVKGSIEMKFYDSNPLGFYCRADEKVWIGSYMPGITSGQVITYEFLRYSKGGNYYADIFENIWNEACAQIKLIHSDKKYLVGNQEEAIKKVLEYFCGCMQEKRNRAVIGVVVLFKDDLRRTFFSCNKKYNENHKCHKKTDGLVGVMCEYNDDISNGVISLWRDYQNDITIEQMCLERSTKIIKKDANIVKFKSDDTIGILSVPLMDDEECIGAITFDFAEFGTEYMDNVKELKGLANGDSVRAENQICKYFAFAGTCADIVQKIIGHDIKVQYRDLFNENWKCS